MSLVLDSSALAAVVFGESHAEGLLAAMSRHAGELRLSAATRVEVGIVVEARQGPAATADLNLLLDTLRVEIVPVDDVQAHAALAAWHRFGKGRHPAGLNFGDCFAYALAKTQGSPLLFVGEDFAQTDVLMP